MNTKEIKKRVINEILRVEGGYVNHSSDLGGQTNYGITEKVQRQYGFEGDMKDLPKELAFEIYQKQYWDINKLDLIQAISPKVQEEVQDTGVNMGTKLQATYLQRSLSLLNLKGKIYPDLVHDGLVGPQTLNALQKYFDYRGKDQEVVLLRMLNALQGARYIEIAEARELNEDFIFGWFLHRVVI